MWWAAPGAPRWHDRRGNALEGGYGPHACSGKAAVGVFADAHWTQHEAFAEL